ncbi:hypothetical protein D9M70_413050 [compost metagenome]
MHVVALAARQRCHRGADRQPARGAGQARRTAVDLQAIDAGTLCVGDGEVVGIELQRGIDRLQRDRVAHGLAFVARRRVGAFGVDPAGGHVGLAVERVSHHLAVGAALGRIGQVDGLVVARRGAAAARAHALGKAAAGRAVAAEQRGTVERRVDQVGNQRILGRHRQVGTGHRGPAIGAGHHFRGGIGRVSRLDARVRRGTGIAGLAADFVVRQRGVGQHVPGVVLRHGVERFARSQRREADLLAAVVGVAQACAARFVEHAVVADRAAARRQQRDAAAGRRRRCRAADGVAAAGRDRRGRRRARRRAGARAGLGAGLRRALRRAARGGAVAAVSTAATGSEGQHGSGAEAGQGEGGVPRASRQRRLAISKQACPDHRSGFVVVVE